METAATPSATTSRELVAPAMIWATFLMSVFGVIGNALIVLATISSKQLQTRCNILITVLAITDCVICLYLVRFYVHKLLGTTFRPSSESTCSLNSTTSLTTSVSGLQFMEFSP
ncbi:hypothetical protein L596_016302 [Steinernema carpocapsae]|uniref:G-protein coupled receptors family 1 profile domain-containing protein n=1 Tax=Steinernema carpocapsae TaxID=34508 RepID=A0A4U5NHQ1_STECR|nr:hypothetical protein L596_016302 [Steinernema carpocapsae]